VLARCVPATRRPDHLRVLVGKLRRDVFELALADRLTYCRQHRLDADGGERGRNVGALAHPPNELFDPERLGAVARTKRLFQGLEKLRGEISDLLRADQFRQGLECCSGEYLRLLA
jgi:hypothetical protein